MKIYQIIAFFHKIDILLKFDPFLDIFVEILNFEHDMSANQKMSIA
jgi:hypothetical protein